MILNYSFEAEAKAKALELLHFRRLFRLNCSIVTLSYCWEGMDGIMDCLELEQVLNTSDI
jgi:hypothetical protein